MARKLKQSVIDSIPYLKENLNKSNNGTSLSSGKRKLKQSVYDSMPYLNTSRDDDDDIAPVGGNKDSWFKSGGFSDGVDGVGDFFGDLGETIGGTVGDLGLGLVKGVGRSVEGIVDLGTYAVGGVGGLLGNDDFKEKAKKVAQYSATDEWLKPATDFVDRYSVLGNKADMVSEGLGQVASIILTGGAGAAAGLGKAGVTALTTAVTGLSSMGSGIGSAYSEGAKDGEAFIYGLGSGTIEAGTELLFGGLGKTVKALGVSRGIGGLDDIFAKKLSSAIVKSISNESVQKILGNTVEAGVKASGEGIEEVLSGIGSAVMKKLTYEDDESLDKLIKDENLLEQFVVGAITSSIAQGADYVKANKSGRDFVTGYTDNEQAVIDKEVEKRVSEKERNGNKLSNKEIGEIEEQVRDDMEHGQLDIETIEEVLGGEKYTSYKDAVKNEDALKAEYEQLSNIRKSDLTTKQEKRLAELEAMNLDDTTKRDSLRKELNDTVFPQVNDSKLAESYKEIERKGQKFEADLSKYNGKQREAVERAVKSGVLNNTYRSHVLVDTLSRIEADKGISFDYTNNAKLKESGFAVEGKTVNGYANKSTGAVTLNVQSSKAWQSVVGHEITHILEGTEHYTALKDALFAYAESKGELANRRTTLTGLYQDLDADVDAELTADLVGDYLFTDKAFIDRLTGNRTLFEKIYDEIKYLCKVATGKELTEIEKVKREFDRAWKEVSAKGSNETGGKNQYSLTTVDAVQPKSDKWARSHTTDEAMAIFPNMWNVSAEESEVRNPTQITSTVNTYRKIYNFLKNEGFDGKILDASSGLGYGTKAGIEEYGFDVEDIEPYPDANYTPKYQDYSTLDEKYDVIISNAVLNVLPQDQRDALVVKMGELLNDGGRLFVNVRGKDVETLARTGKNIHLGNMEWIETVKGSYQKGFTKPELVAYLQDALGDGFTVKPTNIFGGVAAVITKDGGKVQYSVSADSDADYMSAVERGDIETAQRMVDEAAKEAGYTRKLYHGTASKFNVFGFGRAGIFTTDNFDMAKTYGDNVISLYGKEGANVLHIDAKESPHWSIEVSEDVLDFSQYPLMRGKDRYSTNDISLIAFREGYDVVVIDNVYDNYSAVSGNTENGLGTDVVYKDPNQVKSSEAVTYDDNGNVIPLSQRFNDKNDDIRFSLSSMANTFYGDENMSSVAFEERDYKQTDGYKNYVNQCVNNMRQTRSDFDETVARKEIEDQIDGIVRVAIAAKKAGYDIHDDAVKREKTDSKKRLLFSSLEPNSDYFTSSDISTICDKRQNFAEIYDDIVRVEEAKGVPRGKRFFDNVDNYFYLHKILADKGLTQPCRQCYVESMRKNLAPMANAFLRLVNETDANNKANDQLYQQSGKNKGELKSSNAELREKVLEVFEEHPEYEMSASDLTVEMLTTENGLAQLKIQAPLIYEAFNSFYGQSKPKMPKSATPFRFGELTALLTDDNGRIKQSLVNRINSTGGFRLQSYSDFQIQNYTDVLQVIFEAGTLGLNGHAYTKVPAFLEATDGTNLKRNISIFMYKDGNEWKIDRNDSFPYELEEIYDIVNSDESGNTSIIAVSQNKEMSAWIMANDNVGMGIPFHKSGMKMGTVRDTDVKTDDGRIIKGYSGTIDHTKQQTEVWARAGADHKALTKVKKGIDIYSFWDFDNKENLPKNKLIEKNLKKYIDACEEAGYLPKFRDYVMNNGGVLNDVLRFSKELGFVPYNATIEDISFEYKGYRIPYGYYKFLVDFGMFKPNGSASPHETLSLKNYDFDKAVEFFSDAEKLRRNEILQQFANGEERRKYRDSNLSAEELAEVINQKRKEVVNDIVAPTQMSLSKEGEQYAPTGNYSTPFNELAYGEDVAPVETSTKEATKPVTNIVDSYPDNIAPVMGEENAPVTDEIQPMTEDEANAIQEEKAKADKAAEGTPKTRRQLHRSIIEGIKSAFKSTGSDFDEVLKNSKNLSTFATVDNTPQRVMEKALGYKEGQTLADLTVNKVAQNETAGIKWLNSYTDRKNGLLRQISDQYRIKPGSKESAAAQMYAEGFYVNDNNEIVAYGDAELAQDFPDLGVQYRIKGLAHDPRIRQIYDETLDAINTSRTRNAYPEIQKLDNYFLHFRAMDDTFSRLGLPFNPNDIRAKDLPTDLNGVTADLKPGQPYFASAMHRTGKRTSFDLLGGLERYLTSAKNQIYHIDDIQTLRALRNYIADTYGQANGLEGIDALSEEETQDRIKAVYNSHLSTFAKFLNEEANILAGKTALIDRGLEGVIGRRGMTFLSTVQKQTGSNMVGFNISSSLTNFLPVAQTLAKTNKFDFLKAFAQTTSNKISSVFGKNDGFAENSPVMIRRKGAARFHRTPYQKAADAGYVLLSAVDDISTELIARTKFNELTRKGMDEQTAHFETDKWVSRLMGDRSLGQQPQLYNSKTLGFLTQFQLEVRNQLDSQFYDTIQEAKVSNEDIENALVRNAKTAAKVTSTFVQLAVVQHLFGKAFESVAGYNPAFDIISVLATMFGFDDEEDSEDTALDNIEQGFFDLLEDLPYTSTFTGGRIPIASALPIKELIKGEDSYGNEKSRLETLKETAPYYVLPGGYGQLKKTYQGLNMFSDEHPVSGSYTDSGKLRFPVEDTTANRVQAAIFGQYASENAREYFDNDYAPMDSGKYAVAKSVGGYSAYKTYSDELYDIHADKDENGKSINGSRKEKVFDYINNLDADYYTKIILWKSEYPSDDTYNAEIVDYVVNGDFTYDEKVSILTELGFRVTEDGEIYDD